MNNCEPIKIVFWDLDGTLWSGTLEEDTAESTLPVPVLRDTLEAMDRRGILHSIVSQAGRAAAEARLREHGLWEFFVRPKFDVNSKAQAVHATLAELNLLPGNAALIDDLPYHRAEVSALLPDVLVAAPDDAPLLLDNPRFSSESALGPERRRMYQTDEQRESAMHAFSGNRAAFLRSCNMQLTCMTAVGDTLARVNELFARTHRLSSLPNENGAGFPEEANVVYYAATLADKFGDDGLVGAAALAVHADENRVVCLRLAISCRVQGRGVLEAFLYWLVQSHPDLRMQIPVRIVEVNLPLRMALRFCGFAPVARGKDYEVLELEKPARLAVPEWITIRRIADNASADTEGKRL